MLFHVADKEKKKSLRIYLQRVDESSSEIRFARQRRGLAYKGGRDLARRVRLTLRSKTPFESTDSNESLATEGGQSFVFISIMRLLCSATNDNY